jgi:flagellar hook protein FlgE
MDVIGNNIANVNTVGYKKSRVVFKDALYQTMRGASLATDARGGTNPMSIGLGMAISSIDQIHTPAPATSTNKSTDMAIDGSGYFILSNGGQICYSRAGNFDFDTLGTLVNTSNGYRVQGWVADLNGHIDTVKPTQDIDISAFQTIAPKATQNAAFAGNLDSNLAVPQIDGAPIDPSDGTQHPGADDAVITSKTVYDSLGNEMILYFRFFKHEVESGPPPLTDWACDISLEPGFENMTDYDEGTDFEAVDLAAGDAPSGGTRMLRVYNLQFNEDGAITSPENAVLQLSVDRSAQGAEDLAVELDFSALTQYNTQSNARVETQDGYAMGSLLSYSVGIDGTIQGVYDNGAIMNMARVALANFQNPSGLQQMGGNLFQQSSNSGDPVISGPGSKGMGAILPSSLEMSNVDLSEEFTDMIVTQRGFQANSRVITTSDEMLQELVNLKR